MSKYCAYIYRNGRLWRHFSKDYDAILRSKESDTKKGIGSRIFFIEPMSDSKYSSTLKFLKHHEGRYRRGKCYG